MPHCDRQEGEMFHCNRERRVRYPTVNREEGEMSQS